MAGNMYLGSSGGFGTLGSGIKPTPSMFAPMQTMASASGMSSSGYPAAFGGGQSFGASPPTSAHTDTIYNPSATPAGAQSLGASTGLPGTQNGPNSPYFTTLGPSGWPTFMGDMGGIPAPAKYSSPMYQASTQQSSQANGGTYSAPQGSYQGSTWNPSMMPSFGPSGFSAYSANAGPSPYLKKELSGIMGSINQNLTQNILPGVRSEAQAVGGEGGAREGIAQGVAIGNAMTGYAQAASQAMEQANEAAQNRALQAYLGDQGNALGYLQSDRNYGLGLGSLSNQAFSNQTARDLGYGNLGLGYFGANNQYNLGLGGLQNQANQISNSYNLGQGELGLGYQNAQLQNQGQLMNFYNSQRGQDLASLQLAAQLYGQGQQGPWGALGNLNSIFSPYTGFGTGTDTQSQGGGAMGAAGGALAGSALWRYLSGLGGSGG